MEDKIIRTIKINDVFYHVKYKENVGFYVDADGFATARKTEEELISELRILYEKVN